MAALICPMLGWSRAPGGLALSRRDYPPAEASHFGREYRVGGRRKELEHQCAPSGWENVCAAPASPRAHVIGVLSVGSRAVSFFAAASASNLSPVRNISCPKAL